VPEVTCRIETIRELQSRLEIGSCAEVARRVGVVTLEGRTLPARSSMSTSLGRRAKVITRATSFFSSRRGRRRWIVSRRRSLPS